MSTKTLNCIDHKYADTIHMSPNEAYPLFLVIELKSTHCPAYSVEMKIHFDTLLDFDQTDNEILNDSRTLFNEFMKQLALPEVVELAKCDTDLKTFLADVYDDIYAALDCHLATA